MKRLALFALSCCFSTCIIAQVPARPKIVIGIVVDQMRWDYLYRFSAGYGREGFNRLLRAGHSCEQTMINYLPSFTAPGHAAIYTGTVPAINGITGNDWFEDGRRHYCTEDSSVMPAGGSLRWGQVSPRNMLTTTVTDELRLATNFRSRVFSVSLKDRGSVFAGGHLGNAAFWLDDSTGGFVSSTYYMKTLPEWVVRFNRRHDADSLLARDWNLRDDSLSYMQSTPNNPRYEGAYDKEEGRVGFSHRAGFFMGGGATRYSTLRKLPAGNTLSFDFARRCIEAEGLGRSSDPDFLCISLSAPDYIGHQFGPNSTEVEDTYRRLDDDLARFLKVLDAKFGAGAYTLFLTADHGASHNVRFLQDRRIPAGAISIREWRREINAFLKERTGNDSLVRSFENFLVSFDEARLPDSPVRRAELRQLVIGWLRGRPEVAFAADMEQPGGDAIPEPLRTMAVNGYYRPRCGSVQYILKPGFYSGSSGTGTTHGGWNPYDTHIPLLWYGWGIRPGATRREVHVTDIAPTLSSLLKIQMPNGSVGQVIAEVLR